MDVFDVLFVIGWGWVDVMQDSQIEQFYLLEVNIVLGMIEKSLVFKVVVVVGISFQELVLVVLVISMEFV